MMKRLTWRLARMLMATSAAIPLSANAANWADRISITGFASATYESTDEPVYYDGTADGDGLNDDASFQGTRFGLNFNTSITDRLRVAAQMIGQSADNDYTVHVDWAFMALGLSENFDLRAGKIKYPAGIINEYVDVGYAYPWLTPPRVIYSEFTPGPQAVGEAYTGLSLLGSYATGDWTWRIQVASAPRMASAKTSYGA